MMNQSDDNFENQTSKILDDDVSRLKPQVTRRLAEARRNAIEQSADNKGFMGGLGLPAGALAFAGMSTLAIALLLTSPPPESSALEPLASLDLLSANEELEFYQELDFYAWLPEEGVET